MSAVDLTRDLVRLNTVGGGEKPAARLLAGRLETAGFDVALYEMAPGREAVIARWGPCRPVTLTGHLDTVPLGRQPWSHGAHEAEIDGDRLYGRGTSDMKSGLAALVVAAERYIRLGPPSTGLQVVLTTGEETGCDGASELARRRAVAPSSALLVAEPTGNRLMLGHKGALWLTAACQGATAHGSMPHLGVNAIYRLTHAIIALEEFHFGTPPHARMGAPTLNVGTVEGGLNINSVPDRAHATVDIRTVAGQGHTALREELQRLLGPQVELSPLADLSPVWTEPGDPWAETVRRAGAVFTAEACTTSYFTDASILQDVCGAVPTVICGPGEPEQAHVTDEYCVTDRIEQAVDIYLEALSRWTPP